MKKAYYSPLIECSETISGMLCFQDNSNGGQGQQNSNGSGTGGSNAAPKRRVF